MRFRQLRYFCKIVECGSFSRAAATIYVAQPALSQQIAELEAQMGVELLHRSPRGVRATRAGEVLYRKATGILRQLDQIPSLVRSSGGAVEGSVRLGIASIFGPRIVTAIVATCREALPKVTLKLTASNDSASLRDRVESQELDLAMVFENELVLPALSRHPLFRQRLYLVAAQQFQVPSGSVSLQQLAAYPLVVPNPNNVTRALLAHALASAGLSATIVAEVDDGPSLISAVRAGLGATVLPASDLAHIGGSDLPRPVLIEPPLYVTASIVSGSDTPLTRAAEAVFTLLLKLIKRHLESERLP
jgi:LysR family transcriptional regulator, nitrogen assimilation regulatory protein